MAKQAGVGYGTPERKSALAHLADWVAVVKSGLLKLSAFFGTPAHAASATALAAFVLLLAGTFLTSHTGYSLEDWLGWGLSGDDAPAPALLKLWDAVGLRWLAYTDLSFDSLVLLPCYAGLFTRFIWILGQTLLRDLRGREPGDGPPLEWLLLPLVALALADLAENLLGVARLGALPWWSTLLLLPICALTFLLLQVAAPVATRWRWRAWLGGAGLALLTILLAGSANAMACIGKAPKLLWMPDADLAGYACATHHGKRWLLMLVALWLLLLGLAWIFAVLRRDGRARAQDLRALLRSAIGDMLLRSRYVLIALVLLALLVLVMDQARDLAYATLGAGPLQGLFAHGLAAAAAWVLAFSVWLWTRSACEIAASGRPVREEPGMEDHFARYLARLLGMAPLLMFALLAQQVARDGIAGAYADSLLPQPTGIPMQIALAAAALSFAHVLLAGAFAWQRGKGQDVVNRCYYNARANASWLFPRSGRTDLRYTLGWHVQPLHLLILSLAGFGLARLADMTGSLPSLAQAEIAFALAFWVCVFGWLSLQELRTAVPWVLFLVLLLGVLGLAGQDSRHIVWRPLLHPEPLASPANDGLRLAATMLLALIVVLAYALVMLHAGMRARAGLPFLRPIRLLPPGEPPPVPRLLGRVARWGRHQVFNRFKLAGMLFALWLAALGVMAGADRQIDEREQAAPVAWQTDPRPSLDLALKQWLESLCKEEKECREEADSAELPVYLIATAGGGIRAAAWTADLLQSWQEERIRGSRPARLRSRVCRAGRWALRCSVPARPTPGMRASAYSASCSATSWRRCSRPGCSRTCWAMCCPAACAASSRAAVSCRVPRGLKPAWSKGRLSCAAACSARWCLRIGRICCSTRPGWNRASARLPATSR